MRKIFAVAAGLTLCLTTAAMGQRSEFCEGFKDGWNSARGGSVLPVCPVPPVTPVGSTAYREGLKRGAAEAQSRSDGRGAVSSQSRREEQRDFCSGFSEGYRSVKGNLAVVPVCPVPPVTPTGSTAYGEGVKRGMAEARRRR